MLYHQKNRTKSLGKKRTLIVILIFVIGSVFFSISKGVFIGIMNPFWQGETNVSKSFWNFTNYFKTKNALIEENNALKNKVLSDSYLIAEINASVSTSNSLMNTFPKNQPTQSILAGVLVRPPETPYDVLLIDKGQSQSIKNGDTATLPEGSKIGTIIETFFKSSKIKLYSASGEKTSAILERNEVPIVLIGRGGENFIFNLPREMKVEVGDRVIDSSTLGSLLGVVGDIEVTSTDSFKKVLVKSIAHINSLRFVHIIP